MKGHERPTNHENEPAQRPQIYIASLADYNAGQLHGEWLDAAQTPQRLHDDIIDMLAGSAQPLAEEWAIHDYSGFGPLRLSEYEPLETVSRLASGIAEHGPAFAHWADHVDCDPELLDHFEDHYLGLWDSLSDYAAELIESSGIDLDRLTPTWLAPYVQLNTERLGADLASEMHVSESGGRVMLWRA